MNIPTPSPAHMSLSIRRFQLDQYISEIKLLFYHLPKELRPLVWPGDLKGLQARIKLDLDAWLTETSQILPPAEWEGDTLCFQHEKLKLETLYHSAITLLFQPSQVFRSPSQSALQQCYQSSSRKIRIYNHLSTEDQVYYSWRNIHGIFSAGATMVYCIWACPTLQAVISFAEVLWDLRTCSNLLSIGGQWWPSVRNGKGSFDQIVDLTIRRLSRSQPPSPRTRRRLEPQSIDISGQPDMTRTNLGTDLFDRGMQIVGETSSYPLGLGGLLSERTPKPTGEDSFCYCVLERGTVRLIVGYYLLQRTIQAIHWRIPGCYHRTRPTWMLLTRRLLIPPWKASWQNLCMGTGAGTHFQEVLSRRSNHPV